MSADLLRRAAAKIRETARAADPGPWASDGLDPHGNYYVHDVPDATPAGYFGVNVIAENTHEDNANHIALWSPDVAELVASLLDGAVVRYAHLTTDDIEMRAYGLDPGQAEKALHTEFALARRILGEDA